MFARGDEVIGSRGDDVIGARGVGDLTFRLFDMNICFFETLKIYQYHYIFRTGQFKH